MAEKRSLPGARRPTAGRACALSRQQPAQQQGGVRPVAQSPRRPHRAARQQPHRRAASHLSSSSGSGCPWLPANSSNVRLTDACCSCLIVWPCTTSAMARGATTTQADNRYPAAHRARCSGGAAAAAARGALCARTTTLACLRAHRLLMLHLIRCDNCLLATQARWPRSWDSLSKRGRRRAKTSAPSAPRTLPRAGSCLSLQRRVS